MTNIDLISEYFREYQLVVNKLDLKSIEVTAGIIHKKILEQKKIFICGNGGSALTASHFYTDWQKMY